MAYKAYNHGQLQDYEYPAEAIAEATVIASTAAAALMSLLDDERRSALIALTTPC